MKTEDLIKNLKEANVNFKANDSIAEHLTPEDIIDIKKEASQKIDELLRILLIDVDTDHNTKGTADRVSRMFVDEVFRGRYYESPAITIFPNVKNLDQFFVVGPIEVKSMCSHHFQPIVGSAYIGIKPKDCVMGLSKYHRLVDWICRRPQIQEEMTVQIADTIQKYIKTDDLAVIIKAEHFCCKVRGVQQDTMFTTSVMRGTFREDEKAKQELISLIKINERIK